MVIFIWGGGVTSFQVLACLSYSTHKICCHILLRIAHISSEAVIFRGVILTTQFDANSAQLSITCVPLLYSSWLYPNPVACWHTALSWK